LEVSVSLVKQKICDVVSTHLSTGAFSRKDLLDRIDQIYPGTPHSSILPSDYLYQGAVKSDPSNDGNRGHDVTYPRLLERIGSDQYQFAGWDGLPPRAINAPILRSALTV
jgi:hypothetical protein